MVERLRAALRECGAVRLAVLFGSFARGEQHDASDVDVAVLLDPDLSSEDELAIHERLALVSGRGVDLVHLDGADVILRHRVAREGLVVRETRPGDFARFAADAALEWISSRC